MELLQLQDLHASVQAAAEKHETIVEPIQEAAPRPRQLSPTPMVNNNNNNNKESKGKR